ncbi:response regulator [Leeuwenhoekiella aequorea]|uniref:Response regulator receiver domain-containing protein n=1 Tax=Leeuwenhoekiella aequorea TaxID=283736 RepID=A0A4V1KR09_9FLAO|nr:response regulator [Leeuwenhoekiella aequorea]RXG23272.1 response regulator receiver domain-containing protein [Leeuwenhoekiella aequorea]
MEQEVFIIDDDKVICKVHQYLIAHVLKTVTSIFVDAAEALDVIQKNSFSKGYLIYLDINMPELNGWEFIKQLERLKNPERFVIILVTSSVDVADKWKASQFECVKGYVEKPLTKAKLINLNW